jgi:hypothetical protein
MSYKSSVRGTRPVRLITIHTAEGARTARALGNYFWRSDIQASSHVGIDAAETLLYVPYDRAAWTLRSGNPISDNAEMCAFAAWTRDEWLSVDTVDGCANPRAILRNAATWARERAIARGIPLQRLTSVQVAQGAWGLIDHYAWTVGMKDGTHSDVGADFPWDAFMADVQQTSATPTPHPQIEEDHMYILQGGKPGSPSLEGTNIYLLLAGNMFVGLDGGTRADAVDAILHRGAPYKWVEQAEVAALDARSHALYDRGPLLDAVNATNAKLDQLIELLTPIAGVKE